MLLFWSLLPIYLFGNLHCLGMCGPLVLLLGAHPHRNFYFLGRLLTFTAAGYLAGGVGAVLHLALQGWHLTAATTLAFGALFASWGVCELLGWRLPLSSHWLAPLHQRLTRQLAKQTPAAPLFFGLATVLLPCGQTLLVFSACALEGSPLVGAANGAAFALFTSPALLAAMRAHRWIGHWRGKAHTVTAWLALVVGGLALCRGLAELEVIPHFVVYSLGEDQIHVALY